MYGPNRAAAAKYQRARKTNIRALGAITMAVAVVSMVVVATVHRRFSSHALGVAILSVGLLALGRRGVLDPDRVAIARTHLWCSRVGSWLAAIAGWRLPTRRGAAIDAVFLLPDASELGSLRGSDTPARVTLAGHDASVD